MRVSRIAAGLQTSPIITLAAEINAKIQRGEKFYNLTIGDFNPAIFPIPKVLEDEIIDAYRAHHTNYPGAYGMTNLREAVSRFLERKSNIQYSPENILVSSGARPLIYSAYLALVNPGEKVIYPVPSWNNDYYTKLVSAEDAVIVTTPENNFMPTAAEIKTHLASARLIALCSPLNPTGTAMSREKLEDICDLILTENRSRESSGKRPLYLLYDQIYWLLTYDGVEHYSAVKLRPEMRDYTVFIDGISKSFAGTGVRVGWAFGPADILAKMRTIVAHMGAWAPKAEQVASGKFLARQNDVDSYLTSFASQIRQRLQAFYRGFTALKDKGYRVDAIEPQAAIYLTVKLDLAGLRTADGKILETHAAVHRYVLEEAKIGLVPFSYFGAPEDSPWYRLSVGTCHMDEVEQILTALESALRNLRD